MNWLHGILLGLAMLANVGVAVIALRCASRTADDRLLRMVERLVKVAVGDEADDVTRADVSVPYPYSPSTRVDFPTETLPSGEEEEATDII